MKKGATTAIFFIFFTFLAEAQVKVGATPTGKHAKAIQTAQTTKEEIKQRKEEAKRIGEYAKAKDRYKKRYEKLKKQRIKKWKKDSIKNPTLEEPTWKWNEKDSVALAEEVLNKASFPDEYRELIENPPKLPRLDSLDLNPPAPDSSFVNQNKQRVEEELENQAKEYVPDDLNATGDNALGDLTTNPLDGGEQPGIGTIQKPSRPNPNVIKPEAAKELFSKIDPDQFQKVQEDITKLKKKYSSLPDTRKPEEGRKRNSLEDLPFGKRLYFGGNINFSSTDPLILDSNLQIGYWINKKWLGGLGLIIREQFNNRDSTSLTGDAHGYSLFTRYDILKQFYVWGEMQRQLNRSLINSESSTPTRWEEAYLVGIGRDFKVGPVRLSTLVMYDFNYQNNDLNNRPLVFRLGFQVSKKPE